MAMMFLTKFCTISFILIITLMFSHKINSLPSSPPPLSSATPVVVKLGPNGGSIRGVAREIEDGHKVNIFQGIRYGNVVKRFEPPQPTPPIPAGVTVDAIKQLAACPQSGIPNHLNDLSDPSKLHTNWFQTEYIAEDCLFLNVYQPESAVTAGGKKLPVMAWIHGGSFQIGTIFSAIYDGRYIAHNGQVIVVTIAYRLGAFGFLNGGTNTTAPGNAGLLDQILALKWIQQNIEHFGGDPHMVTVFGESAGSMSVGGLIISPQTRGLFRRAIMQSGAPNTYWVNLSQEKSLAQTRNFATTLSCHRTKKSAANVVDYQATLRCMQELPMNEILQASGLQITLMKPFVPSYGDAVLPKRYVDALNSSAFDQSLDLLYGVVRNEGNGFVAPILPILGDHVTLDKMRAAIRAVMQYLADGRWVNETLTKYTAGLTEKSSEQDLLQRMSQFAGNFQLNCPTILFGERMAKIAPQNHYYSYRFMQEVNMPPFYQCGGWLGVCHGDDVLPVFGIPIRFRGLLASEEDYQVSIDMIRAWTQFAREGVMNDQWTDAFDGDHRKHPYTSFMSIHVNEYHMEQNEYWRKDCNEFWEPKIYS